MREFKIAPYACGKIMGKRGLGKTGESYVKLWLKEQIYNRRKEINTKHMSKGLIVEDDSLDFVADKLGYGMILKNEEKLENDFTRGVPDAILKDLVIDVKNSWDFSTFPLFETEIPNDDYYWQAQCYLSLTDKKHYKLIYTLMDNPIYLIEREMNSYKWANGLEEVDQELYDEFVAKLTYPDIPEEHKIKVFDIERNDADIQLIRDRVAECREFINQLKY